MLAILTRAGAWYFPGRADLPGNLIYLINLIEPDDGGEDGVLNGNGPESEIWSKGGPLSQPDIPDSQPGIPDTTW